MTQTVTVVTGATRGLGLSLTEALLKAGGDVIAMGRSSNPDLDRLANLYGEHLAQIYVDLADSQSTERAAAEMVQALNGRRATHCRLIQNAGIVAPILPADELMNLNDIRQAFDVNIAAPIFITAHFLSATESAQDRRVMLISSGAGRNPTGSWGVYCATKAAMDHYANVLAAENHPNLLVSSVAPGVINTGMQVQIRSTPVEKFPSVNRFENMHRDGVLADADTTAARLLNLLESDAFANKVIDDIRNHA